MADPATSPGDPLFYLHHCFVDSLWEKWRQKNQDRTQRESDIATACPYNPFDHGDDQVSPFVPKIKDGYSNKYTDEFFVYQDDPTCDNSCQNSTYLACNKKTGRCLSKVVAGGSCDGLDGVDICYKSKCTVGKCIPS